MGVTSGSKTTGSQEPAGGSQEPADYRFGPSGHDPALALLAEEDGFAAEPGDPEIETRRAWVASSLHGQRLDKALVALAPEFSRNRLQTLIEEGHVRLDGATATTASRRVLAGQALEVALMPTAESRAFRAEPIALAIVHEDTEILVVDKPAGLVVHPAAGHWTGTLLNGLLAHHAAAATLPRAGIVHRLDKDTSGLMVVGKTLTSVTALTRAIAAREVHRQYLALAHGDVGEQPFPIEAPIGRDPTSRVRMAVVVSGRPARTDISPEARRADFSALRCTLHTGRTHQIRVHLASRGHPLVGDKTYGGQVALGLQRQALHAAKLVLAHPGTGETLTFRSQPPEDFTAAWRVVAEAEPAP